MMGYYGLLLALSSSVRWHLHLVNGNIWVCLEFGGIFAWRWMRQLKTFSIGVSETCASGGNKDMVNHHGLVCKLTTQ